MPDEKELMKEAMKEALTEWLDKRYSEFGKWTLRGFTSALFVFAMYLWLGKHGFKL